MKLSLKLSALAWVYVLTFGPMYGEEVTLLQSVVLKADRTMVSLKAGTVVELVSRDGQLVTIRHKKMTGQIPANKLEEPKPESAKTETVKPKEDKPVKPPANPPQTGYGKAVQKAKDSAKEHEKNHVDPTKEIMN